MEVDISKFRNGVGEVGVKGKYTWTDKNIEWRAISFTHHLEWRNFEVARLGEIGNIRIAQHWDNWGQWKALRTSYGIYGEGYIFYCIGEPRK